MMGDIRETFTRLRADRRKALIPFIMGGDPSFAATRQMLPALQDAGADLIELGIPFSDPLADGPVIQSASSRALARGATPARILRLVAAVRSRIHIPIVCLSYWNPLRQFGGNAASSGAAPFVRAARESGLSGLIIPDLTAEESAALRLTTAKAGLDTVLLAAPTSPPARLRMIARLSEGFIYYVSVTGTTGPRLRMPADLIRGVRQLRLVTTKPVCVGFGISTPAHARAVARIADGVIVGSALIQAIGRGSARDSVRRATAFIKRLRREV